MSTLLLVPLDDTVVFPTMSVTLAVPVGDEEHPVEGDGLTRLGVERLEDRLQVFAGDGEVARGGGAGQFDHRAALGIDDDAIVVAGVSSGSPA